MSSIGSIATPPASFASSFLDRLGVSADNADELTEQQSAVRDEINALQSAIDAEFLSGDEDEAVLQGDVLGFISNQFSGENSDQAVAFLLDVASEQLGGVSAATLQEGDLANFSVDGNDDEPLTLTSVLDLALETQSLLRGSNAPIGLQLSVLAELQEGLQDIQA